jgi:hypothetical protein
VGRFLSNAAHNLRDLLSPCVSRSISLFLFPFSGIFGLIYYALAVRRLRSPDPLNLFTSRFALVLPWVMFCADAAGITFVSLAIGWDTIDRLCSRCFFETYDFLPVSGVGNGGTIVTELVLGIIHLGLVVAIFARGLITRRRALAEAERATAQVQAEKKAQMDDV